MVKLEAANHEKMDMSRVPLLPTMLTRNATPNITALMLTSVLTFQDRSTSTSNGVSHSQVNGRVNKALSPPRQKKVSNLKGLTVACALSKDFTERFEEKKWPAVMIV